MANDYWESKMKDFDFEKIQNDDCRLQDFIKDKYVRKKWANTKKTDPMTLIYEGKDPEEDQSPKNKPEDSSSEEYI